MKAKAEAHATRDQRVQRALRRQGWSVMVAWECQTQPAKLGPLQSRLVRFLGM